MHGKRIWNAALTLCAGGLVIEGEVAFVREGAGRSLHCDGAVIKLYNLEDRIRHCDGEIKTQKPLVTPMIRPEQ